MSSSIFFHNTGTDFVPINPQELIDVHSPILTDYSCSFLCHQDPQCRTFVFDSPVCRLYEGSLITGQLIFPSLSTSIVGEIIYDYINSATAYNKSCDHCHPDRYLVCSKNQCQCPANTFWDGQGKCINQRFVDPPLLCSSNDWCRREMNLTCNCNKCRCPPQTFWRNQTCVPQFLRGIPCNTSDQCRNDLQMVCSRINKTCITVTPGKMNVTNGTIPAKFSNLGLVLFWSGSEWWKAFDNIVGDFWNNNATGYPNYLFITFNDTYMLTSFQLSVVGDTTHDPKFIEFYTDENATCLGANVSFSVAPNYWYTFPATPFDYANNPITTKHILINVERWSIYQLWLAELAFFGIPY